MSRAFVKEDQAGAPPVIPPRAALPPGTPNYVTPQGLLLLRAELAELQGQRAQVEANHSDEADRTRQLTVLNGRLAALSERLSGARLVDPRSQPTDEVRFGATVTPRRPATDSSPPEASLLPSWALMKPPLRRDAWLFVAPIARAMLGARLGQTVTLRTGRGEETAEVVAIAYATSDNLPEDKAEK